MPTERIVSTLVMVLVNATLVRVLRLERRRLYGALGAAAVVAALDIGTELVCGLLGVWRYHLSGSILGIPVDLPIDVFLVLLAVSVGFAAVAKRSDRRWQWIYLATTIGSLGTWALFKNTRVAQAGMVVFAPQITVGTAWFAIGNYLAVSVLVGSVALLQRTFMGPRLSPAREHSASPAARS